MRVASCVSSSDLGSSGSSSSSRGSTCWSDNSDIGSASLGSCCFGGCGCGCGGGGGGD